MVLNDDKLKLHLANEGMLLKELCQKSGIAETTLRKIRQGKCISKPATIGKIAKALNVRVEDLID